jgi:hypothetical protein
MGTRAHGDMGRDDGWAVPIVAMIIAFITILSIGGFALSSQAVRESVVVRNESQAFQAANAGIDEVMARLPGGITGTYTIDASKLGTGTSAVINVVKSSPYSYRVTSTGYTTTGASEQIMTEFTRFDLYGMNVNAGNTGDMFSSGGFNPGSHIFGPLYTGNGITTGEFFEGPLFAGGNVTGGNYSGITNAYVGGTVGVSGLPAPGTFPRMPPLPTLDTARMQGYMEVAKTQSIDNKMGDTTSALNEGTLNTPGTYPRTLYKSWLKATYPHYKYYGPAAGISAVGAGATDVIIGATTAAFGNGPKDSSTYDDFAWDGKETLTVNGTVFIDGDFEINMSSADVVYQGNGTIVTNGTVHLNVKSFGPSQHMADGPAGSHQNFPADKCVGFVSPTEIHLTSAGAAKDKLRAEDENIAGAFYCPAQIKLDGSFILAGSVITNSLVGPGPTYYMQLRTAPNLKDVAPTSMPGRNDGLMGFTKWIRK